MLCGKTVGAVKRLHQRPHPFMVNNEPVCTSTGEKQLRRDGSYPSGHTASGWVWGLILAEVIPDSADKVIARGWEYGHSRAVCNVHWQSDVIAGRTLGSIVLARLHSNAEFRADLDAARKEIAAIRASGEKPQLDCAAENAALNN